jgi:hypothetical protein
MALHAKKPAQTGAPADRSSSIGWETRRCPQGLAIPSTRTTTKYGLFFAATRRDVPDSPHLFVARRFSNWLRRAPPPRTEKNRFPSPPSEAVLTGPKTREAGRGTSYSPKSKARVSGFRSSPRRSEANSSSLKSAGRMALSGFRAGLPMLVAASSPLQIPRR